MRCKIFHGRNWQALEQGINEWLANHQVYIEHTEFSTVYSSDDVLPILFYTVLLFYVPVEVEE